VLSIRLIKYRLCGLGTDNRRTYFQLRADIIPRPRLCSWGISALYSSGPDEHGYSNICPSISIINTFTYESKIIKEMRNDSPTGVHLLIQERLVGIWDTDEEGLNLLDVCQFTLCTLARNS
jgi:hypothetical protein